MRDDQDQSRLIYQGSFVLIGQFRRGPRHPYFGGPHLIRGTLLVFPRTSVTITHAGKEPVVADPNTVMFYNDEQVYWRGKLSDRGDLCEWFNYDPGLVTDAVRAFDPSVDDRPNTPFSSSHGPGDTTSYLLQRLMVNQVLAHRQDRLLIEEMSLYILKRIIGNYYRQRGVLPSAAKASAEREIVEAIQRYVVTHFEQNPSLDQIAAELHYSPFHLCRLFRKHTGQSIHKYLHHLRLCVSLDHVTQANTDLSSLALKLGFANHSHFTEAFRKTFGVPPSTLRNISPQHIRQLLSKISIAHP
jgi:AraC family transcriptional regulator